MSTGVILDSALVMKPKSSAHYKLLISGKLLIKSRESQIPLLGQSWEVSLPVREDKGRDNLGE